MSEVWKPFTIVSQTYIGLGPASQKNLSPLVILSMEKKMVAKVISELKAVSRHKIFAQRRPFFKNRKSRIEL